VWVAPWTPFYVGAVSILVLSSGQAIPRGTDAVAHGPAARHENRKRVSLAYHTHVVPLQASALEHGYQEGM